MYMDKRSEKYLELQKRLLPKFTKGYWGGIDCGEGWLDVIDSLDQQLELVYPGYEIHQIKEKFGGLRYYCSCDGQPAAEILISAAEDVCHTTCERCGEPGTMDDFTGWLRTLCEKCKTLRRADYIKDLDTT